MTVEVRSDLNRSGSISLPFVYKLEQNYPNPFNPVTVIRYSIPENQFVSLKLYNVLGKEVAVLVNAKKEAGRHAIEFNGRDLASGIYFYKLEAEGNSGQKFVSTKRMVLIK